MNVDAAERVIGVLGRSGSKVDQPVSLGLMGGAGEAGSTCKDARSGGCSGARSGPLLDSIGFFCSHL